ncbi:MAG: hypothetical protein HPY85_08760 [Anaerolineae bacterium]|nr:hypothetical protein [Anaerolineae bacterium]
MESADDGLTDFLAYWFGGFAAGLVTLDVPARSRVLDACGRACAHSYTVALFRQAHAESNSLDDFLDRLNQHIPDAHYERSGEHTLHVTYRRCGCDLVRRGWVTSPLLCQCSTANLQENLAQALGCPVTAAAETTLLRGGELCRFTVTIGLDKASAS